jgi:hypothetical protein
MPSMAKAECKDWWPKSTDELRWLGYIGSEVVVAPMTPSLPLARIHPGLPKIAMAWGAAR